MRNSPLTHLVKLLIDNLSHITFLFITFTFQFVTAIILKGSISGDLITAELSIWLCASKRQQVFLLSMIWIC